MKAGGLTALKLNGDGLIPAVVQDAVTGTVLMVAYMNQEALRLTLETGTAHFWSRSRGRLWRKGETSGATLAVESIQEDCDSDTLLLSVVPAGPTCHLGRPSCFPLPAFLLDQLEETVTQRHADAPADSYTAKLLADGASGICRKVGEEAIEVILAAHENDQSHLVAEVADLWFHTMVLLRARGLRTDEVLAELKRRQGKPPRSSAAAQRRHARGDLPE